MNLRLVPRLEPRPGGLDAAFKDQVELLERRSDGVLGAKLLEKIGGRERLGADEESIGEVGEEEALVLRHEERDDRDSRVRIFKRISAWKLRLREKEQECV